MFQSIEIRIANQYLHIPVRNGAPKHTVRLQLDGQVVRYFEVEWAAGETDFWAFTDVSAFIGRRLVVDIVSKDGSDSSDPVGLLALLQQSDDIKGAEALYQELRRSQFHFSARRGWINDPNGLVYYDGVYHLFYQHNPFGRQWGNMHWGHATSTDLVRWTDSGDVFYPDASGTMFSGSAVVDWKNTSGLQIGPHPPLCCLYTAAGDYVEPKVPFTQCLAFSTDGGLHWQKFEGNPVLPPIDAGTRDPKVIWHPDSEQWIMALYISWDKTREADPHHFALYSSPNLIEWQHIQDLYFPGSGECPDFFPLPLDEDPAQQKWVFWVADGHYRVGRFDGQTFIAETGDIKSPYCHIPAKEGGYAAQTYSDIPAKDGRLIQIAWLAGELPDMPFNQQMAFPVELSLKTTQAGPRLHSWPVREIETLYRDKQELTGLEVSKHPIVLPTEGHDLLDLDLTLAMGDADETELSLRGSLLTYNWQTQELLCLERRTAVALVDGKIRLRVLLDRASIEIFAADGQVYIPITTVPNPDYQDCSIRTRSGTCILESAALAKLASTWEA
jgi:sucrose-6-phosphate hydrolase SacC (GH32 family)